MRRIVNVVLVLIALILGIWLFKSIQDPIEFQAEKEKRKEAVVSVLKKIQTAQDMYRNIVGSYAGSFDTLSKVLMTSEITLEKLEADPTDPTNQDKFIRTIIKKPAKDSLFHLLGGVINLDSLRYIPYGEGKTFSIEADTIVQQSQKVYVVEVGTKYKDFMGEFASPRYKKYDALYDPEKSLKFGDLNSANTSGNW
jgi:type II secretory pathway pseudopilin PulG